MKNLLMILATVICLQANAQIDSSESQATNYLSIELDPAPFILGGYSFSLKYSPPGLKHLAITGSVYSSKFPDKMMSKSNYEKGFRNLELKTSYAVFTDYYLRNDRSGFYFGPSAFLYSKSVGSNLSSEKTNFKSIYPNMRVGYVYRPFKKIGFYVNPWFNFGKEFILDKNNSIEGQEFTTTATSYVVAIHLGYRINF